MSGIQDGVTAAVDLFLEVIDRTHVTMVDTSTLLVVGQCLLVNL